MDFVEKSDLLSSREMNRLVGIAHAFSCLTTYHRIRQNESIKNQIQ